MASDESEESNIVQTARTRRELALLRGAPHSNDQLWKQDPGIDSPRDYH